ncbi:MAG: hypothetical protein AAGI50_16305 [Pseudomonadota bacterium]
MRWIALTLAFFVAACGGGLTEEERIARCLQLLRDYDRELITSRNDSALATRVIGTQVAAFDRTDIIVSGLRQYSCAVRLSDLPDLGETAARMQAFNGRGAGQLSVPEYLHAGLTVDGPTRVALADYFRGLGYDTRETGAPGVGRRFWVGPLTTIEARRGAEALAQAAQLRTAYTVTRLPYPR